MGRTRQNEGGESLVELIVAVLILGLGVVGLLGGLATAVFGSSLHRSQSDVDAALVSAAETVKNQVWVDCATTTSYQAQPNGGTFGTTSSPAWNGTFAVLSVDYWDGTTFGTACYDSSNAGWHTQRVVLRVTSNENRASQTITLYKRKP